MKFHWKNDYVESGLDPDRFGRWALSLYISVSIDAFPKWKDFAESNSMTSFDVKIAQIDQRMGEFDRSKYGRFSCRVMSIHDALNSGFSNSYYLYSNDIDELKTMVENEIESVHNFFKHVLV